MTKTYLVTFTPLESFSFGTERQFRFEGRGGFSDDDYSPYYIKTSHFPEQTTILGALRYHVLNQNSLIKENFTYSDDDRKKIAGLVGPETYSFNEEGQTFGVIKSISPIFILKNKQDFIIPNPFNNRAKNEESFSPIRLQRESISTSHGKIHLPIEGDYNPKKGYGQGYYNITASICEDKIFKEDIQVGNRMGHSNQDREDGLFKRQVYTMDRNFAFAVYVACSSELKNGYVNLGQKGSLFRLEVKEEDNNLSQKVCQHLSKHTSNGVIWHYFLSDLIVTGQEDFKDFAILEEKLSRNLRTNYDKKSYLKAINRQVATLFYRKGSVVYGEARWNASPDYTLAGYNHVITIKGEK